MWHYIEIYEGRSKCKLLWVAYNSKKKFFFFFEEYSLKLFFNMITQTTIIFRVSGRV